MTITEDQRNTFVEAYTRALVTSWSSEEYAAKLESDPRAALAEVGLELPEGAKVVVVRNPNGADQTRQGGDTPETQNEGGSLDLQVELYEKGLETSYFEFHMPETPQVDTADLDLDELADLAGGAWGCCCCPCCCCG